MLISLVAIVLFCAWLDGATRGERIKLAKQRARFRMFAARDLLRRKMFEGDIEDDRWFVYMDTTLTKSIEYVEDINIWEAIVLAIQFRNVDDELETARKALHAKLEKDEALREAHEAFMSAIWELIVERHMTLRLAFGAAIRVGRFMHVINSTKTFVGETFEAAPHTSTLRTC